MSIDQSQVRALAKAFVETLEKLTPKERERHPELRYGQEMNKLIQLAQEVAPEVDKRLWPQPLQTNEPHRGQPVLGRYEDIETAARQILGLLRPKPSMA